MNTTARLPIAVRALAAVVLASIVGACGGAVTPTTRPDASTGGPSAGATVEPSTAGSPAPAAVATGTPLGERLVATITVANAPCAMAIDETSVWVTSNSTTELDRIDPATNTVVDRITIDRGGCGIAVGPDGRIWVAELGIGSVVAVDPATSTITGRIDDVGPQLWDLKAGFGSIWVADRSAKAVLRIDPNTEQVLATIAVGPQPAGLAVMDDGVWVSDDIDGKVRRIDPATDEVAATADVGGVPSWFADDGGSTLLVAQRVAGKVVSLDATTGAPGTPVAGWNGPLDGTVIDGTAWIPEGRQGSVGVLDLAVGELTHYALPGAFNPFVAEPAFGDVWVLDFAGTTIWRIRP